jgi:hypothetical protein
MSRRLLLSIFCLFAFFNNAQSDSYRIKKDQVQLLFDTDKHQLKKAEQLKLNGLLESLKDKKILSVHISGHTDNEGDSLYNIELSQRRTNEVSQFLMKNGVLERHIHQGSHGEDLPVATNDEELGKSKNRRVNVMISYTDKPEAKPDLETEPVETPPKEKPRRTTKRPCTEDTTVIFPKGTRIVMNKCEFLKLNGCLEIAETMDPETAIENGLNTMTNDGIPLSSCGMIKIGINNRPGCPKIDCFDNPIKILFPIGECDACGNRANLFEFTNGGWGNLDPKKNKIKQVRIDGRDYHQFEVPCPNYGRNCDCKIKTKKVKFKMMRGNKINFVTIGYDCPLTVLSYTHKKRRKHIVKAELPCYSCDKTIVAEVITKDGTKKYLNYQPLGNLKKRYLFARCGKTSPKEWEGRFLGIFKLRKKSLYRKYFIQDKDLTVEKL